MVLACGRPHLRIDPLMATVSRRIAVDHNAVVAALGNGDGVVGKRLVGVEIEHKNEVITEQNKALEDKEKALKDKDKVLENKDKTITEQTKALKDKEKALEDKDKLIAELQKRLQSSE